MIMKWHFSSLLLLAGVLAASTGCEQAVSVTDAPIAPILSPAESHTKFQIAEGLRIELVAAEPMVQEPVAITFDEAGRLWVVEMRGFMPTIDGEGEDEPTGRVVVLEDKDQDGSMDHRTVFLDSLVMPRAMALVDGGILIAEAQPLWYVEDQDGDLVPDSRTLIDADYGAGGLPEHAPNGLWRGMDNWLYNAKSRFRYKKIGSTWVKDSTEFRGQWGMSHDDRGRLFYNYNWSQLHADLVPPNLLSSNPHHNPTSGIDHGLTTDMRIFPMRPTPAVNRGYTPGSLDDEGKLREFTSASSPLVYRGSALPSSFYGNVFVCESAANLIKRNIVEEDGLLLTSRFAYPGSEFLASTDERFRPVNLTTGPDGALYVADMYRGIIQHGAYMTPYLREQILSRGLDEGIHYGRIWRIVPEVWEPSQKTLPADASDADLVALLSDEDGWYRDTAQRLLTRRPSNEVKGALTRLVQGGKPNLGRLHALWTLEGMNALTDDLLLEATLDQDEQVRSTALRLMIDYAQKNPSIIPRLSNHLLSTQEISIQEALHRVLAARVLSSDEGVPYLAQLLDTYADDPILRDAVMSSLEYRELDMMQELSKDVGWQEPNVHQQIAIEMLASSITKEADASKITMLDSDRWPTGWKSSLDAGLLAAGTRVKSDSQGNQLGEEHLVQFARGRQLYLTGCAGCHGNDGTGLPRFAPPLVDSEWVMGDERRLIRILLHGIEGPIEVAGKTYGPPDILPVMPPHSVLDDVEIAAILTYIRNDWGHAADPVSRSEVGRIRHGNQGQTLPWKPADLLSLPDEAL